MDLKYKVGDKVKFILISGKVYKGRIKAIVVPSSQKDLYELGLLTEEELYKNVMLDVNSLGISYQIKMSDILSKIEENKEEMAKIILNDVSRPQVPENKKTNLNIVDYKHLNEQATMFIFEDGTTEVTVCAAEDTFNMEEAAHVAICKKMFGGTSAYNNAVRKAFKQIRDIDKNREREALEKMELEERKARREEKKLKKKAAKRQEQIDIQAEAFLKAMRMYDKQMMNNAPANIKYTENDMQTSLEKFLEMNQHGIL